MITLLTPIWIVLAIPLVIAMWLWRMPTRLLTVLRAAVVVLLLLGLSGLALDLPSRSGIVVVVADRSRSMPDGADGAKREAVERIQAAMGERDRLAVVSFGERPAVDHAPQAGGFGGFVAEVGPDASNLHEALDRAVALIGPENPGRIVVLSDGRWTGRDPANAAGRAAARRIAIDYRLIERPATADLAIESLEAPSSVSPREGFLITAWVRSPAAQEIEYTLRRGNTRIASGSRQVPAGLARLTFRDRLEEPSTASYSLSVSSDRHDPVPENNRARVLVGVEGPRPILLASEKPDPGLGRLLAAGGLDVRHQPPAQTDWSLEGLSNYSAVLLEEVPASEISPRGMENLAQWVRRTGSGLMMTGGRRSFGPGGYFKSPLDPILPVSMELRQEHRKQRVAIVIAMDRSGSMGMPVAGGRTKMDLANLGAAGVVEQLTPMDEVGVLAVDTSPHTMVPLQQVDDKGAINDRILRIGSQGGGIFVYEALTEAMRMLSQSDAGTRHIILFSDAMDSERPGAYRELLAEARRAGITCSVIGLGRETDVDGPLLIDIAQRGEGRIFFTEDAEDLPRLFAQDMLIVARSTFVDEPTAIRPTAALPTLTGRSYEPPPVGGYNLTYLRDGATAGFLSEDEYSAPVLAAWRAGAGRVLAYAAQAEGDFTGPIARWDEVGDLLTAMARWTAGEPTDLPEGMLLTQQLHEGINRVELHLDPDRTNAALPELPTATILRGEPGGAPRVHRATLRWTSPDTLAAEIPLTGTETSLSTVELPGLPPVPLPPVTLPYSPEFRPVPPDRGGPTLRRLAEATGGMERVSLGAVWTDLPRHPRLINLSSWLFLAATLALLLEVLERRTGALSLALQRLASARRRRAAEPEAEPRTEPERPAAGQPGRPAAGDAIASPRPAARPAPTSDGAREQPTPPRPAPAQPAPAPDGVLDALGKARRRARDRTRR